MRKVFTLIAALIVYSHNSIAQLLPDSSLVAFYTFNGNDSDYSIYGNHPTYNNATLTADRFGNENSAFSFNGINQYIKVPNSASLNTGAKISLCAWIKVSGFYYGLCHGNTVLQKGNSHTTSGFYTIIYSDLVNNCSSQLPDTLNEKFYGYNTGISQLTTDNVLKDKWYFVVCTYDGVYGKLYIDGKLKNTNYSPGSFFGNADDLFLGKMNDPQYPYWINGSLDDIRIYNKALNLNEIRNLYTETPKATIAGNVFVDNNGDGTKDSLDYDASYTKVKLSNGDFAFTDYDGNYSLYIDSIGTYIVSADSTPSYTSASVNDTVNISNIDTSISKNIRMVLNANAFDSIYVQIIPLMNAARPGFSYPCVVNYVNNGNTTLNVLNNFVYDTTILQYDSSSSIGVIRNWNVLSASTNQMQPCQRNVFIAYFTVKPTAHLGDSIKLYTIANGGNANASDSIWARIRGSYDPNDKDATPLLTTADVASGKYIDYIVRFENTGTDTAFKVVLSDQLSTLLDINSIQITALSHPCNISVIDRNLKFTFNNILLPYTAVDKVKSHGYAAFRLKPVSTVTDGISITNDASIFFDYNLPIVTNTAITKITNPIVTPLKITDFNVALINNTSVKNIWITSNEINVSHFNVQRSFNGVDFTNVGEIAAQNKTSNDYTFIDNLKNIDVKNLYYRLKAVDKDGNASFSVIKQIALKQTKYFALIFPNPTSQKINISRANANVENLTITDVGGKVISRLQVSGLYATIDVSKLSSGVYLLQFENGENIKFVKQ